MAEGNSPNPNNAIINPIDIGSGSILDFVKNGSYKAGVYFLYSQSASDRPVNTVNYTIVMKATDTGDWSHCLCIGPRTMYLSDQLVSSTASINWIQIQ